MSSAFTVLWAKDFCDEVRRAGDEGKPLTVLFGGSHQSCPSLARARIVAGDVVFPLQVNKGVLHIIAGAVVGNFVGLETYLKERLNLETAGVPEYRLKEVIESKLGSVGHLMRYTCGTEVLLIERSTPIRFDRTVPPEKLEEITFCPRNGPVVGLRNVEDGRLKSALSLQGNVRRLSPETAKMFFELTGLNE